MIPPSWTFADKLRKIRRDVLSLDQATFADRLDVSRKAYASWEMGRTQPRDILALARRVELISGVPATWTLGLDQPAPPPASTPAEDPSKGINRHCGPFARHTLSLVDAA